MDQINQSRVLMVGANYYAGVGGIAPDGSVTQAQLNDTLVSAYNDAIATVQSSTYYNTQMLLEDQHNVAMDNLSLAVDDLVSATATFATVAAVADMASDAASGTVDDQLQAQEILNTTDMTISDADVEEYNTSLAAVEDFAQQAAGFLAASRNTGITDTADNWASSNNVSVTSYTSVTYDATTDMLFMEFATSNYTSIGFQGYLVNDFKTADDIYNTGIAYTTGGSGG